jgi:hypothetical protein
LVKKQLQKLKKKPTSNQRGDQSAYFLLNYCPMNTLAFSMPSIITPCFLNS